MATLTGVARSQAWELDMRNRARRPDEAVRDKQPDRSNVPRRSRTAIVLTIAACVVLDGCSATPIPPTYTQDELRAICERERGWWHPDDVMGGHCEYRGGS
jgi:hypothetical protein